MRRTLTAIAWTGLLACALGSSGGSGAAEGAPPAASTEAVARPEPPSWKTHGLVVPGTHPRLWYDARRLVAARSWYAAHPFTPASHAQEALNLQRATRGLLNDRDPKDQRKQCRAALDWAIAGTSALSGAGRGGAARDNARWYGEAIVVVYDWCHDHLSAPEKAKFIADTNAWLPYWPTEPYANVPMHQNNYYWAWVRNQIEWAVASYEDNVAVAETLLENALVDRLQNDFNPKVADPTIGRGGVLQEGTQYGPYPVGYSVIPFATCSLLGRDLREESSFWKEAVYAFIYSTTLLPTSGHFRFWPNSDANNEAFYRVSPNVGDFMTEAAMRWADRPIGQHARRWLEVTSADRSLHVQSVDPGGPARSFDALPLDYWASGIRYLYGRASWEPGSTAFFLQMGDRATARDYVGHPHGDWGTWQLWRKGRFLSRETAGYSTNAQHAVAGYANSGTADVSLPIAHNALLVDGGGTVGSLLGRKDGIFTMFGSATVPRLESRPAWAFAAVNLDSTIRNPAFVRWGRDFVFVRALETLVVLDRIESRSASAVKTFLVHSETTPELAGGAATITNGDQQLVVTTLAPAAPTYRVVVEGGAMGQSRIEVDTKPGTAQSYILTVLQAKDRGTPALSPSVQEDARSFTVRLDAANRITFAKGMTSAGGSVALGDVTAPLAKDVQRMTVTDAGPAWQ